MKSGETKYTLQTNQIVPEQEIMDAFKKLPQDFKPDIPLPKHITDQPPPDAKILFRLLCQRGTITIDNIDLRSETEKRFKEAFPC